MNKTQLIDAVSERTGVPKVNAKKSIDTFLNVATEALRTGDKITLSGFGSFVVCKNHPAPDATSAPAHPSRFRQGHR